MPLRVRLTGTGGGRYIFASPSVVTPTTQTLSATTTDPIGPEVQGQTSAEELCASVSAASRVPTATTLVSDAEHELAVVPPSVWKTLATWRSAAGKYSSTPTQPTHPTQPVERVVMEISLSAEEGETSPPKGKERAVAQSATLMEVDEALPEAAEHVQQEDVHRAQQEAFDQAQAEAAYWTATSLPSQPAKSAA